MCDFRSCYFERETIDIAIIIQSVDVADSTAVDTVIYWTSMMSVLNCIPKNVVQDRRIESYKVLKFRVPLIRGFYDIV